MFRKLNSENDPIVFRILIVLCFILFAAIVRIIPHPWNFTPVGS